MFEDTNAKMINIFEKIHSLNDNYIKIWNEDIFLTWRWWISIGVLIFPWCAWFILRKRDSIDRLLYSGFTVYVVTSVLDGMGVPLGLWCYIVTPLPYIHDFYIPWDISVSQ
jgi:hypothetical protein